MSDLFQDALSFLSAGGFTVTRSAADFAHLDPSPGTGRQPMLLWVASAALARSSDLAAAELAERDRREADLLHRFEAELATAPDARAYYLVPSRRGLSREFSERATRILSRSGDGGIRIPVEFFDTPYRIDAGAGARRARSVMDEVRRLAERQRRVAQPFTLLTASGRTVVDGDLVEHIDAALRDGPAGARLHFIDGNAGSGKSVAFNALASLCYDEFMEAKKQGLDGRRPIVFLPEHVRGETIGYVDDILDAVVEAEISSVVEPEQLHWLLSNGRTLWMFDGLDEIYAGDNDFFDFLERTLSAAGSQAEIIISARDSLVTSSPRLERFLRDQLAHRRSVFIYELAPWGPHAWRRIAWLELERGRAGRETSPSVETFVSTLEGSDELRALAGLPFYCSLMLDLYRDRGRMPADRLDLLDYIVGRMVDREHGKSMFEWRDFIDTEALDEAIVEEGGALRGLALGAHGSIDQTVGEIIDAEGRRNLMQVLAAVAHQRCRMESGAEGAAMSADAMREVLGEPYIAASLDENGASRILTAIVQFAFFGPGRRPGMVDFAHPILAEYLAGRYAADTLSAQARSLAEGRSSLPTARAAFRQMIGNAEVRTESVFLDVLAREVTRNAELKALVQSLAGLGDLGSVPADAALAALTSSA